MPKVLDISAARSRLTRLVQEAFLKQKRRLIGKHGVPMAALLSIRESEELLQDLEDLRDMRLKCLAGVFREWLQCLRLRSGDRTNGGAAGSIAGAL